MAALGMFLKGNFAHIVTLEGTQKDHRFVAEDFVNMELGKNPTQKDAAKFIETLKGHIEKHGISEIILNRRVTAGQMAGAAGTFIWEGLLLATSPVPLKFVHVATIRATDKKKADLKTKRPEENVPLGKAYDFAFEGLK